jgi:NACalpha-BTF3-like transcription factor
MGKLLKAVKKVIDQEQIDLGTKVEKEHDKTIKKVKKNPGLPVEAVEKSIALDHLKENPHYYVKTPGVTEDVLLLPASKVFRKRIIASDRKKLAFKRLILKLGQNGNIADKEVLEFFHVWNAEEVNLVTQARQKLVKNFAKNLVKIPRPVHSWDYLYLIFVDKSIPQKLVNLLKKANVSPEEFFTMLTENNYDFLEAMADVHIKMEKDINYKRDIMKEEFRKLYKPKPKSY